MREAAKGEGRTGEEENDMEQVRDKPDHDEE